MPFSHDARKPVGDRRAEYRRADEAREKKRGEDAAGIDPGATKWRYKPLADTVKTRK